MKVPNQYRIRKGMMGSDDSYGNNGIFEIPYQSFKLLVVASDGERWEHVSVSLPKRTPNWQEMCFIKSLFWDDEEAVMELHPPRSDWVNNHDYCLHLWKPIGKEIPLPDSLLVGIKELGTL